jgi:hypothetical protein
MANRMALDRSEMPAIAVQAVEVMVRGVLQPHAKCQQVLRDRQVTHDASHAVIVPKEGASPIR